MSNSWPYNEHCLALGCGIASTDQISTALHDAIEEYAVIRAKAKSLSSRWTGKEDKLKYNLLVNRVTRGDRSPIGLAFVWVTNTELFHILAGFNSDGSERTEIRIEESSESTISWSDDRMELVPSDPIVKLKPFQHTPEQKEYLRSKGNPVTDMGEFTIERAKAAFCDDDTHLGNVLIAFKVPEEVTEKMLKISFAPFATDCKTVHFRKTKKGRVEFTYPEICITSKRICYVTFDPKTNDGVFAHRMMRFWDQYVVQDGTRTKYCLAFDFARIMK